MNETTPPHPHDDSEPKPSGLDRFFSWVRGLGIVRGGDRWFAGVAGGIAAKAGIDPLIVRGIFVVLAVLGGPGLLLYLAAWLLLPDTTGRIHAEEVLRGRASTGVIVTAVILAALVLLPLMLGLLPRLFAGPFAWDVWGLLPGWLTLTLGIVWWAVIVPGLIIWVIVWVSTGGLNRGAPHSRPTHHGQSWQGARSSEKGKQRQSDDSGQHVYDSGEDLGQKAEVWGQQFSAKATEWGEKAGQQAEAWGEKIEQQANEWERRGHEYHEAHKLGAGHTLLTLALALLAGGVAAVWGLSMSVSGAAALTAGLITAVAVLGLSAIVAGIRGRNTGWVGFLSFIGVLALIFSPIASIDHHRFEVVPFGHANLRINDTAGDRTVLMLAGNSTIDLTVLDRGSKPHTVELWLLAGNVTVVLPDDHPVRVRADLLAGNLRDHRLDEEQQRQGGIFVSRSVEAGSENGDDSELSHVRIRLLAGNVVVEGGLSASQSRELLEQRERAQEIEQLKQKIEELEQAK